MKILALLVRYPQFIHRYGEVVQPGYFEFDDMRIICRQILDFYRRYAVVPTCESFLAWVQDYEHQCHVPPKVIENLTTLIGAIFTCDMSDGDAIRDSAVSFAKRQALKSAIMKMVDKLEQFDDSYESAVTDVTSALMVGNGLGSLGTEVYGTIPQLPGLIASANNPYSSARKIPTPFPGLNNARNGGLGPGELLVLSGGSGAGKSHIANNFAVVATMASQGQWIAHATMELTEMDNHLRYAARILDLNMDDIVINSPEFINRCARMATDRRIYVKYFNPGITTVGHIRSWISALSGELGIGPCMVIIDYPDLLAPTKGESDSLYINNGRIYSEIVVLLNDYQAVGIAPSQFGRDQQGSSVNARAGNIANSIAKLYNADVVGSINQSEEDMSNGVGRIWWDKVRRGRGNFYTYYRIYYAKSTIVEDETVAALVTPTRGERQRAQAQGGQQPTPPLNPQAAGAFAPPPTFSPATLSPPPFAPPPTL